ncbi:MAG: energy-coupling factor transporter ATPase [Gallicola sp.]|nr:energy-coupling factor transporter ATPase [Gallicola sp.]
MYFRYNSIDEEKVEDYALKNVNIEIHDGEFVAIIGHNGSGKSTLAKLLNGLFVPTSGDIIIDGMNTKDEREIWNIRSHAGMVFQNPDNQIITTIVEEEVAFGPENLGLPSAEIKRRVDRALEIVGMEKYIHHAPHLLSGGQKQRIAIAGILAMNPKFIILDEPTAMLDPNGRKEVINKEENKTILLITHNMEETVRADRIIVMNDGEVAFEGTPREVFSRVEEVKALGLDVPEVTELAYALTKDKYLEDFKLLTIEEFVNRVC